MSGTLAILLGDFVRSLGVSSADYKPSDILSLELDDSTFYTVESVSDKIVVISIAKKYFMSDGGVFESILNICKVESKARMSLHAGLVDDDRLILSLRIPIDKVDVTVLHASMNKLLAIHGRLGSGELL